MQVHFIWPDSPINLTTYKWDHSRRAMFWLTVTPEEVEQHMKPLMSEEAWKACTEVPPTDENYLLDGGRFSFAVPAEPTLKDPPVMCIRVYPYSGMWNGHRPWIAFGKPERDGFNAPKGLTIASLSELFELQYTAHNSMYLTGVPRGQ